MPTAELVAQILSTVRSLDARLDELKLIMTAGVLDPNARLALRERMERLVESRFCLVYSLMDLRCATVSYLNFDGNNESATKMFSATSYYDKLKRQIR